ncbi:MAG: hypothetical protein WCO06_06140 [Candidatus Roizmanbacteria bacterium]
MIFTPSILTKTTQETFQQIHTLFPYFHHFQIDIVHSSFAEKETISVKSILEYLSQVDIKIKTEGIFDFDLMTFEYENDLALLDTLSKEITIGMVMLHYRTLNRSSLPKNHTYPIGIALSQTDSLDDLIKYYEIKSIPAIQIMTVEPGKQGNPFIPKMLDIIDKLKKLNYEGIIYIDGAINKESMMFMQQRTNLPNVLCPGSYLSNAGDELEERVAYLKSVSS